MEPNTSPSRPLDILVVDDYPDAADSLAELLRLYGHVVRVTTDPEKALRLAEAEPPDVVLLEVRLVHADGCAIGRSLCARSGAARRPLLVAVTGGGSADDRARTRSAGFDFHLVKPVEPALLAGVLERFRRLLAPTIPAADLDPPPEEPPDRSHTPASGISRHLDIPWFVLPTKRLPLSLPVPSRDPADENHSRAAGRRPRGRPRGPEGAP